MPLRGASRSQAHAFLRPWGISVGVQALWFQSPCSIQLIVPYSCHQISASGWAPGPDYEQTSTVGPHPDIRMVEGWALEGSVFPSASTNLFPEWAVLNS